MDRQALLTRIERHPDVLSGRPTVRGLRITVDRVIGLLASGLDRAQIINEFPELEPDDIAACEIYVLELLLEARRTLDDGDPNGLALAWKDLPVELVEAAAAYANDLSQRLTEMTRVRAA